MAKVLLQDLSPRLVDFLEIASYVFSADCATPRGTKWSDDDSTEPWGRDLAFIIPVREPEFWAEPNVKGLIEEVLRFLSNDRYSFTFVPLKRDRAIKPYFKYGDLRNWPFYNPERVLMFSGGLDSLAGAVETAAGGGKLVLVSHRPVSTVDSRQKKLFAELQKQFPHQLIRIPVWINKKESLGREPTQRTRSFLYSALGAVVAQSVQAGGVRFYENGIVSLNLPIANEALRARATRTTHPVALHLLSSLCAAITERDFAVDNPYLVKTKTDVVATLSTHQAAHLISHTCSCAHLMFKSRTQQHCGCCSQCIDRRFAVTAAGLLAYDSDKDYVSDVFVGPRKNAPDRTIAVDYCRHGIELHHRSKSDLAAIFNTELSRAVCYETKRSEAAQKIIAMHQRHGEVVLRVLQQKLAENAARLIDGTLDDTSLLALVIGQRYLRGRYYPIAENVEPGRAQGGNVIESSAATMFPGAAPANVQETLAAILAKLGGPRAHVKKVKHELGKRDTVIFAAIVLGLKGMSYCSFLHEHGIKPKWADGGQADYRKCYLTGNPLRKKIQDEKTRAKVRMDYYPDPVLADAFNRFLPERLDELSTLLHSRNSRHASKNPTRAKGHKH